MQDCLGWLNVGGKKSQRRLGVLLPQLRVPPFVAVVVRSYKP